MSRVSQLFDLQQIDTGIDTRIARMRQLDAQMIDSPDLLAVRAASEEARALLSERQGVLKRLSHEAEETKARLKTQEQRLYGGSIKNPKELSQVQEEVGHLRERLKALEESELDAMLSADEAETAVSMASGELDKVEKDWQHHQAGLLEEKDKLTEQSKVLQVKKQRFVKELPWADLQAYERLRRSKGGMAVAAVHGALCGGCHVAVPVSILRTARSSAEFTTCPSCGRILYPADEVKFKEFDHGLDNVAR
jgi:predicted  nucleic acid-binding Zn-ribbon protein